jgi:hypothetical protein
LFFGNNSIFVEFKKMRNWGGIKAIRNAAAGVMAKNERVAGLSRLF